MKKNGLEKSQKLAAFYVTPTDTSTLHAKSTIYAEQGLESQPQQSDSAQFTIDSILVFTTLGVELGNLLTTRQKKLSLNSPIGY
jgi:hypothetical protein